MKDQITQDLLAVAGKSLPPATVTAVTYMPGLTLSQWAMIATIVYTCVLTLTAIMKNWGDWMGWWAARFADSRRVIAWMRGRG